MTSQNLISRPVLLSPVRSGGKRETGANPVRTRHCKRGVVDIFADFSAKSLNFFGKACRSMIIRKSGNLPEYWYGKFLFSKSRGLDCTVLDCAFSVRSALQCFLPCAEGFFCIIQLPF